VWIKTKQGLNLSYIATFWVGVGGYLSPNTPRRPIGVFPMRYEYNFYIKSKAMPLMGCGGSSVYFL
jgi:hypothetical protein